MDKLQIIQGNSLKILPKIKSNSVNLIIADPPYDLNKNYDNNSDKQSKQQFLNFSYKWLKESKRILCKGGTIYTPLAGCNLVGVRFTNDISYLKLLT